MFILVVWLGWVVSGVAVGLVFVICADFCVCCLYCLVVDLIGFDIVLRLVSI